MQSPRCTRSTSLIIVCPPCALSQPVLLKLAQEIFPEGQGRPNGKAKLAVVFKLTNGLVLDAKAAVSELFRARGYDPRRPDYTKQQLGYTVQCSARNTQVSSVESRGPRLPSREELCPAHP